MYRKLFFLALLLQTNILVSNAQDIHSSSPIVFPQSPSTSYIVNSTQTVKISSQQSVTFGAGTWFQQGSNVLVQILNSPVIPPAPNNPSLNLDKNWVYYKTYNEDGAIVGESKSFYDNSGKLIQNQMKSIAAGHVLANQSVDDALGRPALQTLSAPINNSAFNYKDNFISNSSGGAYTFQNFDQAKTNNPDPVGNSSQGSLGWYYSNNNTIDNYVPATAYPYQRTDFYSDGTGAIKRSASVGGELKMGSGRENRSFVTPVVKELAHYFQIRNKYFSTASIGEKPSTINGHAVQNIFRDANGKEAVAIMDESGKTLMTARAGSDLITTNTYSLYPFSGNFLYFKVLEGGSAEILTSPSYPILYDMNGQEQVISWPSNNNLGSGYYKITAANAGGEILLRYINGYSDISYNFYNAGGQLVASIPPNGVKELIVNGLSPYATLSSIPFVVLYEYDLQGRLVANTQPDAGRTEYIYRQDGNIRFSQNSVQRNASPARFSYINYDRWARPIEAGEYVQGSISFTSAKTNNPLQESVASDGGLTGGTKNFQVSTKYDQPDNTHGLGSYIQDEFFLKGAISLTQNSNSKTWYNYDGYGRVIWTIKQIAGLGNKTIDYLYDGSGNIVKVDFQKDNALERFTHEYEYDADNRLKVVYTSTSASGKKEQARYYYYLHGPLKRVELAQNLQGIDYTYTPQGWLKSINHPKIGIDPGTDNGQTAFSADAFSMTLEYFNGDYTRAGTGINSLSTGGASTYNGNIVAQSWKSLKPASIVASNPNIDDPGMVTYSYDDRYQFNSNKYGTPNFTNSSFSEIVNVNKEYNVSYDPNGNIKTLSRNSHTGAANAYSYNYQANTNKLSNVNNYASYSYDDLGQMTGQQRINGQNYYLTYDVNGKVTAIYSDLAKTQLRVSFTYDEAGSRIKKTDHTQNTNTYYVNNAAGNVVAIYDNKGTTLSQKEVPLYGASRMGVYSRPGNNYNYELADHLGNIRAVINGNKLSNGNADIIYYSDYYPFGSALTLQGSNDYRYGYQGQYAEVDKETGWNNFDLRMYDPAIGRWMSTDPYGQYSSPYLGMGNNPVSLVDPDGGYGIVGGFIKWASTGFKGEFHRSNSEYRNGEYFISHKDTYTGEGGGAAQYRDFGSEYLGSENTQFIMNKILAETADRRIGHYNEYTKRVNGWGGVKPNYVFEELIIGGAVAKGVGLGFKGAVEGGGRVFWSGGDIAKNAAMDFAKSNGMKTLEMTTGGRMMNSISPYLPRSISGPIWDGLSRNFARGASGNINVFQNAAGVSLKSTWRRVEYPILQNNNIFYHIVK